jgi:hypothetical protein
VGTLSPPPLPAFEKAGQNFIIKPKNAAQGATFFIQSLGQAFSKACGGVGGNAPKVLKSFELKSLDFDLTLKGLLI